VVEDGAVVASSAAVCPELPLEQPFAAAAAGSAKSTIYVKFFIQKI
jgi:hypothetical protein